jgi:hypothetical protein
MSHRERYIELIRRHLGRGPERSDGLTEAAVTGCERRLGVRLPAAVRAYYLTAGRLDRINRAHNLLFGLDELRIEDSHLLFMEENQAVVHWGIPARRLSQDDPVVYQRANADGAGWYSEKMRFSRFLTRMFDWQAGFADAPA